MHSQISKYAHASRTILGLETEHETMRAKKRVQFGLSKGPRAFHSKWNSVGLKMGTGSFPFARVLAPPAPFRADNESRPGRRALGTTNPKAMPPCWHLFAGPFPDLGSLLVNRYSLLCVSRFAFAPFLLFMSESNNTSRQ
jgi:hypothetical protein